MKFQETKLKKGYRYNCTDFFGEIEITSPKFRLVYKNGDTWKADLLDEIFCAIYKAHKEDGLEEIKNTVKDTEIEYIYRKKKPDMWKEVFTAKIKEFLEKTYQRPFALIPKEHISLFGTLLSENGYKLDRNLKNIIIKKAKNED